jgi:hypothetical protein
MKTISPWLPGFTRAMCMAAWLGAFSTAATWAQRPFSAEDPDWRETGVAAPPTYSERNLFALERTPGSSLQFGLDLSTLQVGADGVVRYVVVARGDGGARFALYEGVRCATDEVRVYARRNGNDEWRLQTGSSWQDLRPGQSAHAHAWQLARSGLCVGRAPNGTPRDMKRDLRADAAMKFR